MGRVWQTGLWVGVLGLGACTELVPEVNDSTAGPTAATSGSTGATQSSGVEPTNDGTMSGGMSATQGDASTSMGMGDADTTGDGVTTDETATGDETTTTTGEPEQCHPMLVEVTYDPGGSDDEKQWVKLYNNCRDAIDLSDYSLGWGGDNYTDGTLELSGTIEVDTCFIIGGPSSEHGNHHPSIDLEVEIDPDFEKVEMGRADGVALFFLDEEEDIMPNTVPLDAVIYGLNNTSNLLDSEGNTPDPHVGDAKSGETIRREAPNLWVIELAPVGDACPTF